MALSYSKGLRNFLDAGGSLKQALQGGVINVYSGAAPVDANAAITGSLLYTFCDYAGSRGGEALSTGTANYTGGAGGQIATLTVNGVSIIGAAVDNPGVTLASLMSALAAKINSFVSSPDYTATSTPTSVTIVALPGTGAGPNGFVVTGTIAQAGQITTMAGGTSGVSLSTSMSGGVTSTPLVDATCSMTVSGSGTTSGELFSIWCPGTNPSGNFQGQYNSSGDSTATPIAAGIAAAVNAQSASSPNLTAGNVGAVVNFTATTGSGAAFNGSVVSSAFGGSGTYTMTASATLSGGTNFAAEVLAKCTVDLSTVSFTNISDLTVNGVTIINAAVPFNSTNSQTATDLAASINTKTSAPDYTASAVGSVVTISAVAGSGATPNGFTVNLTTQSPAKCSFNLSGSSFTSLTDLTINGVTVINAAVPYNTTDSQTATDIASSINTKVSAPDYTAVAVGTVITITAVTLGTGPNGFAVKLTCSPSLAIGSFVNMAGGAASVGITFTLETRATGTLTLTGGGAGNTVNTVTVNGVDILGGTPVPFNSTLAQTASDIATAINQRATTPEYTASSSGAVVTITAQPGTGATPNGFVVTASLTGVTATFANMASGVTSVNGLKFAYAANGSLKKLSTQRWFACPAASATGGYFRLVTANTDTGQVDTAETFIRVQGTITDLAGAGDMKLLKATYGPEQSIGVADLRLTN